MSKRTHGVDNGRQWVERPVGSYGADTQGLQRILTLCALFYQRRWQIIVPVLVAATLTFVVTEFCLTHYYQASAIIRPVSRADQGSLVSGMLAGVTSTLGSLTGLASDDDKDAEKYISIANSYQFTMTIVKRSGLTERLTNRSRGHQQLGWPVSQYSLYQKMSALF